MGYWLATLARIGIAGLAMWGDRRRQHRTDLNRVGMIPWPLVLIVSVIGAATCIAVAIQEGA